jgi:hypothetical protein
MTIRQWRLVKYGVKLYSREMKPAEQSLYLGEGVAHRKEETTWGIEEQRALYFQAKRRGSKMLNRLNSYRSAPHYQYIQ